MVDDVCVVRRGGRHPWRWMGDACVGCILSSIENWAEGETTLLIVSVKARGIACAGACKPTAASRGFLALFDVGRMRLGLVVRESATSHDRDLTTDRESAVPCCRTLSGDDVPRKQSPRASAAPGPTPPPRPPPLPLHPRRHLRSAKGSPVGSLGSSCSRTDGSPAQARGGGEGLVGVGAPLKDGRQAGVGAQTSTWLPCLEGRLGFRVVLALKP